MQVIERFEEMNAYFRTNHIVRGHEHEERINEFCRLNGCLPLIREVAGGEHIRSVWYGYVPAGSSEAVIHPGWLEYLGKVCRPEPTMSCGEKEIEDKLAHWLECQGLWVDRQVRLESGIADIIAGATIFEVKNRLTRDAVLKAAGQLLLYGTEVGASKFVIVGRDGEGVGLAEHLKRIGVNIWLWRDTGPVPR